MREIFYAFRCQFREDFYDFMDEEAFRVLGLDAESDVEEFNAAYCCMPI